MKVDIVAKAKFAWQRITVNRLTFFFTILSLIYCVLQTAFAGNAYAINQQATSVLKHIYDSQKVSYLDFTHYNRDTGIVNVCQTNDQAMNYSSCPIVWPPSMNATLLTSTNATSPSNKTVVSTHTASNHTKRAQLNVQVGSAEVKGMKTTNITGLAKNSNNTVAASDVCMQVMKWPMQTILNDTREDLALIFFQLWVFALVFISVLHESVPHLIVIFISHLMIAIWSAFQLIHALSFESDYDILIRGINGPDSAVGMLGQTGACDGQDLLPFYFGPRKMSILVLAIVNFIGFLVSGWFTYKLYFQYDWATFKRIGASPVINRSYRLAMVLFICIQLSLFFVMTAVGLWVDQLFNGVFGPKARLVGLYRTGGIVIIFFIIPWLIMGWMAVRREYYKWMLIFMALSAFFTFCWIGQVLSDSWRLTYKYWSFFAAMEVVGIALTFLTCIFGIVCRIFCFGRGLSQYLRQSESASTDGSDSNTINGFDRVDARSITSVEAGNPPALPPRRFVAPAPSVRSKSSDETLAEKFEEEERGMKEGKEAPAPAEHSESQQAWASVDGQWSHSATRGHV